MRHARFDNLIESFRSVRDRAEELMKEMPGEAGHQQYLLAVSMQRCITTLERIKQSWGYA